MAQAKIGDTVRVHYTGTLDNGSIFDTSEEREAACGDGCGDSCADHGNDCGDHDCGCSERASGPLEFVIGQGNLLARFEEAVVGLEPGQSVRVEIAADDAYGQRLEQLVAVVERSEIPDDIHPEVGDQMEVVSQDGSGMLAIWSADRETASALYGDRALAWVDVISDIRLMEIVA